MTQRPEDIQRRLKGLGEIGDVVGALRAIASGHANSARGSIDAISAYAGTVSHALSSALALTAPPPPPEGPGLLFVVGAAQGFCGAYSSRIAEAASNALEAGTGLLVVGHRTSETLRLDGHTSLWSADLPGHASAIPDLASRVTDKLIDLSKEYPGPIRALTGSRHAGAPPMLQTLLPLAPPELGRALLPPILTLPPSALLTGLLQEALFASVAHTLIEGLEAESLARVDAMARAQNNLRSRLSEVQQSYRQARQEQMTTEMIELSLARRAHE